MSEPLPESVEQELDGLRESVASREAMLSTTREGVVLFDPGGGLLYANTAARSLLGGDVSDRMKVEPQTLRDALDRVRAGAERAVSVFERGGRAIEATVTQADPVGSTLIIVRDVTVIYRTEELRRNFVGNASHELKTPVASIVGLASALELAAGDEAATRRFVSMLNREADRLSRLVSDLLDLSRLESDPGVMHAVRLDHVLTDQLEKQMPQMQAAGLQVVADILPDVVVMGRESDLGLMVRNLLGNAIRYTPEHGSVTVLLKTAGEFAVVSVADTGIGIPADDLGRVFERFYRVDAARDRETGGTGLGLAIVRHVAETHGGSAVARSVRGQGSTFEVKIPVLER